MATKKEVTSKAPKAEVKAVKAKAPKVVKVEVSAPKAEVKAELKEVKVKAPKATPEAAMKAVKAKVAKAEVAPQAAPAKKAAAAKTIKKVTLGLPKEAVAKAKTVAVVGDFNNWAVEAAIELKKQKDGSFKTTVELEGGKEYQYRFLLNGETWENAWDAPKYVSTPFGVDNSVVVA